MSTESTVNELEIPDAWDAKLVLDFLQNPAFDGFSQWIDARLAHLEGEWLHASSPNALRGSSNRRSSCRSI